MFRLLSCFKKILCFCSGLAICIGLLKIQACYVMINIVCSLISNCTLYLLYGQLVHIDNPKLALVRIVCFSVQFISRIRILFGFLLRGPLRMSLKTFMLLPLSAINLEPVLSYYTRYGT